MLCISVSEIVLRAWSPAGRGPSQGSAPPGFMGGGEGKLKEDMFPNINIPNIASNTNIIS
jgi:hypothetical protein